MNTLEKNSPYLANLRDLFKRKDKPYTIRFKPTSLDDGLRQFDKCNVKETIQKFETQQAFADYLEQYKENNPIKLQLGGLLTETFDYYPVVVEKKSPFEAIVGVNVTPRDRKAKYLL